MLDHAGQLGFIRNASDRNERALDRHDATGDAVLSYRREVQLSDELVRRRERRLCIALTIFAPFRRTSSARRSRPFTSRRSWSKTFWTFLTLTKRDYASLRLMQYASGPMAVAQLRQAIAAFGPILAQIYGMTECGLGHHPPSASARAGRLARMGSPTGLGRSGGAWLSRARGRPDGSDCEPEEQGEIWVKGPGVMVGYWNNHPATFDAVEDGWMKSGDIGAFDKDRFLFVLDRKKDMIFSGGENIYPREVEEALYAHPAVAEAAVIGVPDSRWGESVKAFVVVAPGSAVAKAT